MDLPWKNGSSEPAMSGMEMALKSVGLGEVITAARAFANDQTIQKIMAFANEVGELSQIIRSFDDRLNRLEQARGLGTVADNSLSSSRDLWTNAATSLEPVASTSTAPGGLPGPTGGPTPVEYRAAP